LQFSIDEVDLGRIFVDSPLDSVKSVSFSCLFDEYCLLVGVILGNPMSGVESLDGDSVSDKLRMIVEVFKLWD